MEIRMAMVGLKPLWTIYGAVYWLLMSKIKLIRRLMIIGLKWQIKKNKFKKLGVSENPLKRAKKNNNLIIYGFNQRYLCEFKETDF